MSPRGVMLLLPCRRCLRWCFWPSGVRHWATLPAAPQHRYLLRLVDAPKAPLPLPQTEVVLGRGPFLPKDDLDLMRRQGVEVVVTKNSGGDGARAKLEAARLLGLPVIMIDRPDLPRRPVCATVPEVMHWLHGADRGVKT